MRFGAITVVTNDKELKASIITEVPIKGFNLSFMGVQTFFKKLGG